MATKDYYATLVGCLKWKYQYLEYINEAKYNGYTILGPRKPRVYKTSPWEKATPFSTLEQALEYIDAQSS